MYDCFVCDRKLEVIGFDEVGVYWFDWNFVYVGFFDGEEWEGFCISEFGCGFGVGVYGMLVGLMCVLY